MDTLTIVFLTFLPCFVIAGVAIAIHLILRVLPKSAREFLQFNLTDPGANQPFPKTTGSYRIDPDNRALQQKLFNLVGGDVAIAKRLLRQQRQLHQGKSENWYLEKVIYDLERDRRR